MSDPAEKYRDWASRLSDKELEEEWEKGTSKSRRSIGKDPTEENLKDDKEHGAMMKAIESEKLKRLGR